MVMKLPGNTFSHKTISGQYVTIKQLGEGGFGSVYLAKNALTNEQVAIKYIDISSSLSDASKVDEIYKESKSLNNLSHPSIIKLIYFFRQDNCVVLIMEYASGGELKKYVQDKGHLNELEAREIFTQLVDALYYCHNHYVIHRDIKLENILMVSPEDKKIKLIDFGIAGTTHKLTASQSTAGSLLYMAPEIFQTTGESTPMIDIWSMGVLLYSMLYGDIPFNGKSESDIIKAICTAKLQFPTERVLSAEVKDLIGGMLQKDPQKRTKMQEIKYHKWFDLDAGVLNDIDKKDQTLKQEREKKKKDDEEKYKREMDEFLSKSKKKATKKKFSASSLIHSPPTNDPKASPTKPIKKISGYPKK